MWVNVIPLLDDVGGHTDIHAKASLFISDQEVQNAAQMMLNLRGINLSDFLNEGSDLIQRAMYTEANRARYEAHSERMQGNQHAAGSHNYPSGRQTTVGNNGNGFGLGNRVGVVHEDAAILADFGK